MSIVAWVMEHDRALFWVAATDSFIPAAMSEWQRVDLTDVNEHIRVFELGRARYIACLRCVISGETAQRRCWSEAA
jgi:hypothetical protein